MTQQLPLRHKLGLLTCGAAALASGIAGCGGFAGGAAAPESVAASAAPGYPAQYPQPAPPAEAALLDEGEPNTESYDQVVENAFLAVTKNPLSTFSVDVDTASYANTRRFLAQGKLPPKDAVRIEELINYFDYDYPDPSGAEPFSVTTEVSVAPWKPEHRLVHIGLQGKRLAKKDMPPRNLVFLLDVSGSMGEPNKLPLLKRSLKELTETLTQKDRIAIVVYAGASGQVLPSTSATQKTQILGALERLEAGGSTNGGEGIELAYEIARRHFRKDGINRVILATDGDFNVGVSSPAALSRLIEEKRKTGVFLTVLGFGMGNYKDSTLEKLADKGNGNYAYIDDIAEARKVLVQQAGATLVTIAKDVKIQVEFNPKWASSYRLIGYENRLLANEDFNNDKKDAGDIGAGHTVTALYEVVPVGAPSPAGSVDALKYQKPAAPSDAQASDELMTVKLRYKAPQGDTSKLISEVVKARSTELSKTSNTFRYSASVAAFGMLLRASAHAGNADFGMVKALAEGAESRDPHGYWREYVGMVRQAERLKKPVPALAK
ncbi:MAG TPA: VWA domain-containing protein [Polyangiaceae bacterium]|nr:VWA domain-containing protein [Polyangiaceae bacterium]